MISDKSKLWVYQNNKKVQHMQFHTVGTKLMQAAVYQLNKLDQSKKLQLNLS